MNRKDLEREVARGVRKGIGFGLFASAVALSVRHNPVVHSHPLLPFIAGTVFILLMARLDKL